VRAGGRVDRDRLESSLVQSDAGVSGEGSPTQVPARGGRLGNAATRAQNAAIAAELKDQGYTITGGGGVDDEEYIEGAGSGIKGGTFVDITAVNETTGKKLRVQTVDTLADGTTPTPREQAAIARILNAFPDDELWIIPKMKLP
jgi:filamentous hemagglutinin